MRSTAGLMVALLACLQTTSFAQSNPVYIRFDPRPVKAVLYRPDSGPAPYVAILTIHRTGSVLGAPWVLHLAQRGFLVLAMNPRSDNNEAIVNFEENALDIKTGVEFLRKQPGITKVLLYGHSGGGPATSFYQAVAEQGVKYCQGSNKIVECTKELAGLPAADALILMDAHPSNAINGLRDLNPAVVDENPGQIDPALDPFSLANGYNPKGSSRYSAEFQARYYRAQAARMNRLIDTAKARLTAIRESGTPYPDNDAFLVTRAEGGRLIHLDTAIAARTLRPQKLIRNDGTVVTQIVESVRRPMPEQASVNASFDAGARLLTLRSFLSANAVRARDSMNDIDWCSTNSSVRCALGVVSVPILLTAMTAAPFLLDAESHYDTAVTKDKDLVMIEGATHGGFPCVPCETTAGQYSNTERNHYDYITRWINARYQRSADSRTPK